MTNFFLTLLSNEPLVTGIIAWGVAALLKVTIEAIKSRQWDWERVLGPGGMPSTHTTPIVACATSIGFVAGFETPIFALATVLCFVVAYDAAGIRRHAGDQAKAITNLINDLTKVKPYKGQNAPDFFKRWNLEELETLLGHNPLEVAVGIFLGIITSVVIHYKFGYLFLTAT